MFSITKILHIISFIALLLNITFVEAQITVTNKGTLMVKDSQQVFIRGNLVNDSDDLLNRGDISITGNFINNAIIETQGTGIIRFIGPVQQSIILNSSCSLHKMEINNPEGALLMGSENINVYSNLDFTNGIIRTDDQSLVVFQEGAGYQGATDASHIEGPTEKIGEEDFIFPVGRGDSLRPIIMTNLTEWGVFRAEYFNYSFWNLNTEAILESVSSKEYWDLKRMDGDADAVVSLTYNASSGNISAATEIARFDQTMWRQVDATIDNQSSPAYKLISDDYVSEFSSFTFSEKRTDLVYQLETFNGYQDDECDVILEWLIKSELAIDQYEIEMSYNGTDFYPRGVVEGDSIPSPDGYYAYRFVDEEFHDVDEIYYRLKIYFSDGRSRYVGVVKIDNICKFVHCQIFPNPVRSNHNLNIRIDSETDFQMPIKIYDVLGRFLWEQTLDLTAGKEQYEIFTKDLHLASGTYFLWVNKDKSLKFVVIYD